MCYRLSTIMAYLPLDALVSFVFYSYDEQYAHVHRVDVHHIGHSSTYSVSLSFWLSL